MSRVGRRTFILLRLQGERFGLKPSIEHEDELAPTEADILEFHREGYICLLPSASSEVVARFALTNAGRSTGQSGAAPADVQRPVLTAEPLSANSVLAWIQGLAADGAGSHVLETGGALLNEAHSHFGEEHFETVARRIVDLRDEGLLVFDDPSADIGHLSAAQRVSYGDDFRLTTAGRNRVARAHTARSRSAIDVLARGPAAGLPTTEDAYPVADSRSVSGEGQYRVGRPAAGGQIGGRGLIRHHAPSAVKWLVGAILAAVVAVPVTATLTHGSGSHAQRPSATRKNTRPVREPDAFSEAIVRPAPGFGPPRPAFRCAQPSRCAGPTYVTFDSYINNPKTGDERPFLAIHDPTSPNPDVVDQLNFVGVTRDLTLRAYIDNNTYQNLPGVRSTDATDTRMRLALPSGPVYSTNPTVYLYASNARPKAVWDTVTLSSPRPLRLTYIPGSSTITREAADGRIVTDRLDDGLASPTGLRLGRWKADFRYSGYVTFRVRVRPLNEPVRDPQATRAIGGQVVYPPAVEQGLAKEPVLDGTVGDRFTCTPTRCEGPPFPELDAYQNHPLLGDEADFVRAALASEYGDDGVETYRTVALVHPGDQLKVRIAIDNGGDPNAVGSPSLDQLLARNVRVRVLLPSGAGHELRVVVYLESTTTRPRIIADTLPVRSAQLIRLRLRPETAGVLTAAGLRPAQRVLFASGALPSDARRWGVRVGDIPPSFSQVAYVEFCLRVDTASR